LDFEREIHRLADSRRRIMSEPAQKTGWPGGAIAPKPETFQELIVRHSGPIVMLNLLKFKRDAGDGRTGAEAYAAYGAAVTEMITSRGGEILWSGRPEALLIGGSGDEWDMVALVRYPSPRALAEMGSSPEYQAIHHHREAGLERTVLIACSELRALGAS
jgi:uncharacterized protein (DUF1330 family)